MNDELCSLHTHTHPNTGRLCVDIKLAAILVQSSLWLMRRSRSGRGRPQLFEFLACAAGKIGGAFEARSSMFINSIKAAHTTKKWELSCHVINYHEGASKAPEI